ncbi:hypothetical protein FRB99_007869 [Tulasnella sp. 403]|nr:hypothetical protein FRB99_007869 [Tulasnella sp. 403]
MTDLVSKAVLSLGENFDITIVDTLDAWDSTSTHLLQWSSYDHISHDLTREYSSTTGNHDSNPLTNVRLLSSSYIFRKALIRKHFLHKTFTNYIAKYPDSLLVRAVPRTWSIEIAFADELDELWSDELYELGGVLDRNESQNDATSTWWILKPGMSDRGMGIRMFRTRDDLAAIFHSFDDPDSDEEQEENVSADETEGATRVATSQLRHFVIQEYLPNPLLIDPARITPSGSDSRSGTGGRKFHLRVYCIASGALTVYVCSNILALFAPVPYTPPHYAALHDNSDNPPAPREIDLTPHLTNTCLQRDIKNAEDNVWLLSELVGSPIHDRNSSPMGDRKLTQQDVDDITHQVYDVIAETFKAALKSPIHFQVTPIVLPNSFELFGADLLVTCGGHDASSFDVKILELNAEPAIENTGARLGWILEDLVRGMTNACVGTFFSGTAPKDGWQVGESRFGLRKCLSTEVRGSGAW